MPTRIPAPLQAYDPKQIGRYQVLGRIGAGAMGQVYLARSPGSRLVAVKTIRAELAADDEFRRRFAHEVAAAKRVGGAFTAPVVDADPDAELPWLATVYLPVPSLSVLVDRCGTLPVPAVRWLAAGCAEALECIHQAGLVHRDLKPANVLVAADGPRVIDFGLVRAEGLTHLTAIGDAMGTPSFMAPEQAAGEGPVGPAADVFALGATLVFAATGGSPYRGRTTAEAIYQMIHGKPDLSDVPAELQSIVAACLAKDPAARPTPAQLMEYHSPYLAGAAMSPPLPATALKLIADYGRRLTEELGRVVEEVPTAAAAATTAAGAEAPIEEWERELDRFLDQGPIHPGEPAPDFSGKDPTPRVAVAGLAGRPGRGRGRAQADSRAQTWDPNRRRDRGRDRTGGGVDEEDGDQTGAPVPAHRRRLSLRATLTVVVVAGIAGGLGYSLHIETTTRMTQAAATATSAHGASASPSAGQEFAPPPGAPAGGPPSQAVWRDDGGALEAVRPPYGDQITQFYLHGSGWTPGEKLSVTIVGDKTVLDAIVADSNGGFEYAVNAKHEFFPGDIPPGVYKIEVGAGSLVGSVQFSVASGTTRGGGFPG